MAFEQNFTIAAVRWAIPEHGVGKRWLIEFAF
jgi:hypothetical protein